MRKKIREMKDKMANLDRGMIDVGRRPLLAIDTVS